MKKLDRDLGLFTVISIAIGAMIGGGIFILPGLAADITGSSLWLAYVIAGLLIVPAALSKSELATAMPQAGGVYVFIDRSMGPMYGTIAGIGTWLTMMLKSSFALIGIGYYLSLFDIPHSFVLPIALVLLIGITFLNVVGVKKIGKLQILIVFICLGALGILSTKGIIQNTKPMAFFLPTNTYDLLSATGLVFISYAGVTKIASIAEEINNPTRNLPLAMMLSLFIMICLYSIVSFVMVSALPMTDPSLSNTPTLLKNKQAIAMLGDVLIGPIGKTVIAAIAIIALASMANAGLLAASRYPLAMGRDGMVPAVFEKINERFVTPVFSIFFTSICMSITILFLPVVKIAKLASGMQVLLFIGINVAVIMLRESHSQWYQPAFRTPFYPFIQIFGMITGLGLLFMLGQFVLVGTLILIVIGIAWFWFYAKTKTQRRGALQKLYLKPKFPTSTITDEITEMSKKVDLIVPLTDKEVSTEALLELASAFGARYISFVHLVELPDQTNLGAVTPEETPHQKALERRLRVMAKRIAVHVHTDFLVSHDRRHALYEYIKQVDTSWVLMEFGRHPSFYKFRQHLGWVHEHLYCHLAIYSNKGIQITQKIMVLIKPDQNESILIELANNLAEIYDANLTLVSVSHMPPSEDQEKSLDLYLEELKETCTAPIVYTKILNGSPTQAIVEESINHDLLLMGLTTLQTSRWGRLRLQKEQVFEEAACSVLAIKASENLSDSGKWFAYSTNKWKAFETGEQTPESVLDLLDPRTIRTHVEIPDKRALFGELGKLFEKVVELPSEAIQKAFVSRELQGSTTIGFGVAIPHANLEQINRTWMGLLLLKKPILFDEETGEKVDIILCTLGTPMKRDAHVKLLKDITNLLQEEKFIAGLKVARNTNEVIQIIRDTYQQITQKK